MDITLNRKLAEKFEGRYAYMYAMYPNNNFWSKDVGEEEYKQALRALPEYAPSAPTLLYVHFPYCTKICHFCSCYKVRTGDYSRARRHLDHILKEMERTQQFLESEGIDPNFKFIHCGGGSPTYLENEDFARLAAQLRRMVNFGDMEEFAVEIDPRHVDQERLRFYHSQGVTRISFGVQDFDPEVQQAVNRIQPPELLERLLVPELRERFSSVSFDILSGLPKQTLASFRSTMETVVRLSPDRVVLLSYNHSPTTVRNQRAIEIGDLPSKVAKEEMFAEGMRILLENGYQRVGIEHFARPGDKLCTLWESGDFNWNMSGYGWGNANKIVSFGPHSVSRITDDYYFQNIAPLPDYEAAVEAGRFPIARGYRLSEDEKIRREVTIGLRSRLQLDFRSIEKKFGIEFKSYFAKELSQLEEYVADGVIRKTECGIEATEEGMPFVAFICMIFDKFANGAAH